MTNTDTTQGGTITIPGLPFPLTPQQTADLGYAASTGDIAGAIGTSLNPLGGTLSGITATLGRPDFWIRVGIFVAGAALCIVGIVILVSSSKIVADTLGAAGQAAKLTPAGAAASVATEALT